jgi:hypothetical protein
LAALVVLFSLAGGSGRAAAQEVQPFQLTDIDGLVELGFLTDLEDRSRSIAQNSDFDRIEFSQLLDMSFEGYVYHPRFLTFDAGFEVEAIEDVINTGENRILFGSDWRFDFLKQRSNSLSIYGRILEAEFARPFAPTYELHSQLYGVTFFQRWGWIPFDLTYQHRTQKGGVKGDLDEVLDEVNFRGDYELGEQSSGRIEYDLVFEEVRDNDVRREGLVATNLSYFGDESEKRLFTNLRLTEQEDFGQLYTAAGNMDFDWRHSENLSTHYLLHARWNDAAVQTVTNVNPSFYLTHQLYESLRTHFELFGRIEDASFGSRNEFGSELTGDYLKWLDEWIRLGMTVSPRIMMTHSRPDQVSAFAIDESHVMRVGEPVVLRNTDVINPTIVVTNESGSIEYEEGPLGDYIVIQIGDGIQTRLELTPGGDIADGETVLVDYTYRLAGKGDVLTTGVDVLAGLWLFERVRLYGRYEFGDQDVVSGEERDFRLNSYDRYLVGLELNWPWMTARFEYEDYDANFGPFRGFSGSLSLFTYSTESWQARFNSGYVSQDYVNSDEKVDRLSMSASARRRIFSRGMLEVEGNYLRERWSGSSDPNDLDAFYVKSGFSWWYGQFEIRLETEMAQLLRKTEDKRVFEIDLRVRRSF